MAYDNSELIKRAKAGDALAFNKLTESYSPLINSSADRFYEKNIGISFSREDFIQEAVIAFYSAVNSYTEGKVTFGLYAKICIRNRLISLARKATKEKKVKKAEKNKHQVQSRIDFDAAELFKTTEKLGLSSFEYKVLTLYLQKKSYAEIASELGKSPKSVDNALCRVKSKIKRQI